ncbi:arylsulfatase [Streptomyces sp. ISL-43]|nr:arylsulfatase [Streptomyces sp. ISL-43]
MTLLHTSPVHVPVFEDLRERHHPGAVLRHLVVPELLERARARGPESQAPAVRELLEGSAGPVLVTCSTIGAVGEALALDLGVPVLRVDRPMAADAVRTGPRIAVLATVESTLAPTVELLEEEAAKAGRPVSVRTRLVEGAWDRFAAGDDAGSLGLVAASADALTDVDVIVLAQVSMTGAAALVTTSTPVLSSPASGLAAALGE